MRVGGHETSGGVPLPELRRYRSADEHDLAGRSGLEDFLVRARCVGEWQFLTNNGSQSAVFEACKEPGVDVRLFLRCNAPERERTKSKRGAPSAHED